MTSPASNICAEIDQPILFRTALPEVYKKTLESGSLWLRSGEYFRTLEDRARSDKSEGANDARLSIPLLIEQNGVKFNIKGEGGIGQDIIPHYILSLHGTSIGEAQRASFGGCTFGIKNLHNLTKELYHLASQQIQCSDCRFGQVSYQYACLSLTHNPVGGAAMRFNGDPPVYLNPLNTDVLRKQPVMPFIEQDEWRIVIFTDGYLKGDPSEPLKVNVCPSHFYPYIEHN